MKIEFTKMQGAGNDYIYVNTLKYPIMNPQQLAVEWSRPHTGIGSDGLVLIGSSETGDFSMRIFNADGSEAMMCGNASRCIGKYLYEYGLTDKTEIQLETLSGLKLLKLDVAAGGRVDRVTVDMGVPTGFREIQLGDAGFPYKVGWNVSMGNPHLVVFVDKVEEVDLANIGPRLECHPSFPDRVNVEFAQVLSEDSIRMRVWERGSGITMACGTGACATLAAAAYTRRTKPEADVVMDGGTLHLFWQKTNGHLMMSGPAVKVFDGQIEVEDAHEAPATV